MSPMTKSKSKDKKSGKESQKTPTKILGSSSAGSGVPASAYNPLLGTFHTLDTVPMYSTSSLHTNARFRNIDDMDEHSGNALGTGTEYDSVSNNDSWSVESEDHKEKAPNPSLKQETVVPGGADNEKREKIRQKNERKHKRQKERRAQELQERSAGYLMSRKLEALAQQLVSMGFTSERATMALILNEGRVEESVTWLFEGHEGPEKNGDQSLGNGNNLKIDISDELAQVAGMEIRYNCSRQDVERAIVASEGDLVRAAESLRMHKQDLPALEENGGPPIVSVILNRNIPSPPPKPSNPCAILIQQKRDEKEFNYTKVSPIALPSDLGTKLDHPLRKVQAKLEWMKPQQIVSPTEKQWVGTGPLNPTVTYALTSPPLHVPLPPKIETHYTTAVGTESKILVQPNPLREPVVVMQRPKSNSVADAGPTSSIGPSLPGSVPRWRSNLNSMGIMKHQTVSQHLPNVKVSHTDPSSNQVYWQIQPKNQSHHHAKIQNHQQFVTGMSRSSGLWSRPASAPTLSAASSLGLFSGFGSSGPSGSPSTVDWNKNDSNRPLDYASIDWSLDLGLSPPNTSDIWSKVHDPHVHGGGSSNHLASSRLNPLSMNGARILGLHENGVTLQGNGVSIHGVKPASSLHEWESPFECNDIFSSPRHFVSPPNL